MLFRQSSPQGVFGVVLGNQIMNSDGFATLEFPDKIFSSVCASPDNSGAPAHGDWTVGSGALCSKCYEIHGSNVEHMPGHRLCPAKGDWSVLIEVWRRVNPDALIIDVRSHKTTLPRIALVNKIQERD